MIADWLPLSAPQMQNLGWTLLHFVWQGLVIGLVFLTLMRTLSNASPRARYWAGMFILLVTLAAPIATFVSLQASDSAASLQQAWTARAGAAIEQVVPTASSSALERAEALLERLLPWVVVLWAVGVAFLSLRVAVGWRRLRRLTTQGVAPLTGKWPKRIAHLCRALGLRQKVQVLESTLVAVPTVMGFLKPVVLMPAACLMRLSTAQLELLIAHELGHVRRWDYVANLFQVVVETLLFYHPVVRWISRRVRAERENCCDDLVVARCGQALTYAKALTNLESLRAGLPAYALAATGGQLSSRIERLVLPRSEMSTRRGAVGNLTVAALIAAVSIATMRHTTGPVEDFVIHLRTDVVPLQPPTHSPVTDIGWSESTVASSESFVVPGELAVTAHRSLPPLTSAVESNGPSTVVDTAPVSKPVPPVVETSAPASDIRLAGPTLDETGTPSVAEVAEPRIELSALPLREIPVDSKLLAEKLKPPAALSGPVAVRRVAPNFPRRARIGGQSGHVLLSFLVLPNGKVGHVKVHESSPPRMFDREAKKAINRWRFDPNTVAAGGERLMQRFDFALDGVGVSAPPTDGEACHRITGTRLCLDKEF